mmetsp:Transcript_84/g.686  ORF Transcript_84/g.686 Transcript_84/m.686 type:complete len:236 (+) Transcript_84:728-1435(+)
MLEENRLVYLVGSWLNLLGSFFLAIFEARALASAAAFAAADTCFPALFFLPDAPLGLGLANAFPLEAVASAATAGCSSASLVSGAGGTGACDSSVSFAATARSAFFFFFLLFLEGSSLDSLSSTVIPISSKIRSSSSISLALRSFFDSIFSGSLGWTPFTSPPWLDSVSVSNCLPLAGPWLSGPSSFASSSSLSSSDMSMSSMPCARSASYNAISAIASLSTCSDATASSSTGSS